MSERQLQLIREYITGITNRRSFIYFWAKEYDRVKSITMLWRVKV